MHKARNRESSSIEGRDKRETKTQKDASGRYPTAGSCSATDNDWDVSDLRTVLQDGWTIRYSLEVREQSETPR